MSKKIENVNPDTPVVYIGELGGKLIVGKIYTILYPCYGNFLGTWKPALYLKEMPGSEAFLMSEFAKVKALGE